MAFPPRFLDEVRARLAVSDVVGRKVKLTRRGREFVGLSPFNKEKTPSFTINDEKGFYHCFSSGEHGDIFAFVMKTEGLSFPEAVEKLAGEAGVPVPRATPEEQARDKVRASLYEVLDQAADWYHAKLYEPTGRVGLDYLRRRGLDDATIKQFRLGFAPNARGLLTQHLTGAGIGLTDIGAAGLVKLTTADDQAGDRPASRTDGKPRDYFFNRVIFPIADRRGRVLAFGGRTIGDGQPKYLNSPDTVLFQKGAVLYGWAQAREAIRTAATVIVTEGYMDVIALARAGIGHAVAPLGTALTETQISELWRMADEPVLCFDGDRAGLRAAGRAALRALPHLKPGKSLAFATLPEGEDPDSLIAARGVSAFNRAVEMARPLVDILWAMETAGADLATPERRAALEANLEARVREIGDQAVSQQYRTEFRARLGGLLAARRQAGRDRGRVAGRDFSRSGGGAGRNIVRGPYERAAYGAGDQRSGLVALHGNFDGLAEDQERALVALIINHPGPAAGFAEVFADIRLSSRYLDKILHEVINLIGSEAELDTEAVKRHLMDVDITDLEKSVLSDRVYAKASYAAPETSDENALEALYDILDWHRRRQVETDRRDAEQELAEDMTEARADRLQGILREQFKEDSL